ncbi:SLC13 family permease [Eubacterium pyruvativorans]|uniref:SLC13 family permease n=1 Tax=Eubacterium pyruvativorans TaxID=155865 RepID=UPI003F895A80
MTAAQIAALVIFIIMFLLIVTEKIDRHIVSLTAGALMLILVFGIMMHSPADILKTLAFADLAKPGFWITNGTVAEEAGGINWATILFIGGMMVMVEGMAKAGFFRWLCLTIAKAVHYRPLRIFVTFMFMSAVLAMFIDSITVILFLASVTIELANMLKFNPIPVILSEIFCANLGGSSTMCGDPPNIIIGTSLHYTFSDFILNNGPIAGVTLLVMVLYFYLAFRHHLSADPETTDGKPVVYPSPSEAIQNRREFAVSTIIFLVTVVLLITHAQTGLTVATIGVGVAVVTLITAPHYAKAILREVDYRTLLFFIGLFIVVDGLDRSGILQMIANLIAKLSGNNPMLTIGIVIWLSAIASAFVDNIPFAATMVPVIKTLSTAMGIDLTTLAWTLSLGTDVGGSATPIGASANVVGISVAAKNGHLITWRKYCKYAAPATIISVAMFTVLIFVRYL